MELGSPDVASFNRGSKIASIGSNRRHIVWIGAVGDKGVDEINLIIRTDASSKPGIRFESCLIPPDLRHLESIILREVTNTTGDEAKALMLAKFFAAFKQQLLPKADSEQRRPAIGKRPNFRSHRGETLHRSAKGADSGNDELGRALQVLLHRTVVTEELDGLLHPNGKLPIP